MKLFGSFVAFFLISSPIAGPITGNSIIETEKVSYNPIIITEGKSQLVREMLQNPGFETGLLSPWTTNNWIVDTVFPHQGRYCASDTGDFWIRQNILPINAFWVNRIFFWARQPEAPAAQAYQFIYSDSSIEGFIHYPIADWAQYDVTENLNRQKILVAFRLWGYSGGGPNPDSTYIDDVSITRNVDVGIDPVLPPDTIYISDTLRPLVVLRNYGVFTESILVWCRIEHTCSTHIYRDSTLKILTPGYRDTAGFDIWIPRYTGRHRLMYSFDPNDTTWHYFWVGERSGVKENDKIRLYSKSFQVRPGIGESFELICIRAHKSPDALKIYNTTGKLVWSKKIFAKEPVAIKWYGTDQSNRNLPSGVYLARFRNITKRIVLTE